MQALAEQGYAVFSINMSMQFSFENGEPEEAVRSKQILADHLSRILKANDGEDMGFPISFEGRLCSQNITLVGHSRNGQGIFWLTPIVEELGANVNGLFAFAPSVTLVQYDSYPDIPSVIFLPSNDGDVISMEGQRIFDELYDTGREADIHLAYLFGGNHAAFNEALLRQDNRLRDGSDPEKTVPILEPALQRSIYVDYILDFLKSVNGDGMLGGLPHGADGYFYGERAMLTFMGGGRRMLPVDFQASGGAVLENVIGSYMYKQNTAGFMRFPGDPLSLPLYQISWENEAAAASMPLERLDASGFRALVIDMAQDSTSPLNGMQDQAMAVTLSDSDGNTASVSLPRGTISLSWQRGEVVDTLGAAGNVIARTYSDFTPISSAVLPLADFEGVDLQSLQGLTLEFESRSGCIVVRSVSLVR
jgi:dienelactone hydrolase